MSPCGPKVSGGQLKTNGGIVGRYVRFKTENQFSECKASVYLFLFLFRYFGQFFLQRMSLIDKSEDDKRKGGQIVAAG
jgi:hypothetical protein